MVKKRPKSSDVTYEWSLMQKFAQILSFVAFFRLQQKMNLNSAYSMSKNMELTQKAMERKRKREIGCTFFLGFLIH